MLNPSAQNRFVFLDKTPMKGERDFSRKTSWLRVISKPVCDKTQIVHTCRHLSQLIRTRLNPRFQFRNIRPDFCDVCCQFFKLSCFADEFKKVMFCFEVDSRGHFVSPG